MTDSVDLNKVKPLLNIRIIEKYNEGYRVNGVWFRHKPTQDQINEAYKKVKPDPLAGTPDGLAS